MVSASQPVRISILRLYSFSTRKLESVLQWLIDYSHNRERFTIFLLPPEWQEVISAKGWVLLTGFVAFEIFNLVSPFRVVKLDHFAHLGGYLIGAVWALAWNDEQEKKRRKNRTWFERVMSE
jgi:rhomboid-like protein